MLTFSQSKLAADKQLPVELTTASCQPTSSSACTNRMVVFWCHSLRRLKTCLSRLRADECMLILASENHVPIIGKYKPCLRSSGAMFLMRSTPALMIMIIALAFHIPTSDFQLIKFCNFISLCRFTD